MLEREKAARENCRLTRLLQVARFRLSACVEDVNFRVKRGLNRALVLRLASGEWIRQHQTVLLILDRLTQQAHRITPTGGSLRRLPTPSSVTSDA